MPYRYAYLIGCITFSLIWLLFFVIKRSMRQEMLFASAIGVVLGPTANYLWYLKDWWFPEYIFGITLVEDVLLGFASAGIAAVAYEILFNKKYTRKVNLATANVPEVSYRFGVILLVALTPMLILYYGFHIHSFYANTFGLGIAGMYLLFKRPDLWKDSLLTFFLLPLISLPAFWVPELLSPGWISTHWMFHNLSGIMFLGAPLEDVIWYAFSGFCIGSVFEYLFEYKIK